MDVDLINEFERIMRIRGRTKETIKTYLTVLRFFEKTVGVDLRKVGLDELELYLETLRNRNVSQASIRRHFIVLNGFYKFLLYKRYISENPVPEFRENNLGSYKDPEVRRRLLTIPEARKLVNSIISIRDQTIVLMLLKLGVRRRELVSLDVSDIDFEHGQIQLKPQKKRSNCVLFLDSETEELLKTYLKYRPKDKGDALFISRDGTRLSGEAVLHLVEKHAALCGLHNPEISDPTKHIGAHNCRHFFTTMLQRAGMNRQYVKWLRGDKMVKDPIDIYTHIDPEAVREEYIQYVPQLLGMGT